MLIKLILKNTFRNRTVGILTILTFSLAFCCVIFLNWIFSNIEKNLKISQIGTGQNKFIIQAKQTNLIKNFILPEKKLTQVYKELQINPNIKEIFGIYMVQLPVSANIHFGNVNFNTDILLFASDKRNLCFSGKYIVAGINPTLVNIYNSQIANSSFFPKVSLQKLKAIKFELIFGKNSIIGFSRTKKYLTKIIFLDSNLPIFGLTIGYKIAKEITKNIGGNLKLTKIIGYTKSHTYLQKLKQQYPNFKITTEKEILHQIKQKLSGLKFILKLIQSIILILVGSFLIVVLTNIKEKNYYISQTLIYNQANKFQVFTITYGEFIIYILIAILINFLVISWFNKQIPQIEKILNQKGYIIKLNKICLL